MEKTALETSKVLFEAFQASIKSNPEKEIAKIEEQELWPRIETRTKAQALGHHAEIGALSGQIDVLRSKISHLRNARLRRIDVSLKELEACLKPHKREAAQRIAEAYTRLERLKSFSTIGPPRYNHIQQVCFTVETNIPAILQAEMALSRENQAIHDLIGPLSELNQRLERALQAVPRVFANDRCTLTDSETLQFAQFVPEKRDVHDPEWQAVLLPADTIERNIRALKELMAEKVTRAA